MLFLVVGKCTALPQIAHCMEDTEFSLRILVYVGNNETQKHNWNVISLCRNNCTAGVWANSC